jgi:outer membrane protein OmpA-like peptidoglycan-associated protein
MDQALARAVLGAAGPRFLFGGNVAVIKHLNNRLGLSAGVAAGLGGSGMNVLVPAVDLMISSPIGQRLNVFFPVGVNLTRVATSNYLGTGPDAGQSRHFTSTFGLHAGIGMRHFFTPSTALRIEGRMAWDQFAEAPSEAFNSRLNVGLAYFTNASPPVDTDGDGVVDRRDTCANTPRGATVNASGCPSDGDRDGVFDGLDRCATTPANTPVDSTGCVRDTDGDRVADNVDRCPNTPAGMPVDANGCPRDSDGDGVADNVDRCPSTPANARPVNATGCPTDSDADGVADFADRCPNSPAGSLVNETGCPRDTDGDGVVDNLDRCAGTPANTRVNAMGCPAIPDADNDGVPDSRDRCANSPVGRAVDSVGCTLIALPANAADQMVLRVQFVTGRSTLVPASTAVLDSVATAIIASPGSQWEVQGFTDSRGSDRSNQILSQARAQAVVNYLVSKGVPRASMTATGFGEARPVASNETADGRAQNRRVQLVRRAAPNPTPLP